MESELRRRYSTGWKVGSSNPRTRKKFSLLWNVQDGSKAHPVGIGVLSWP